MRPKIRRTIRSTRGQAAVEFVVAVPIALIVLLSGWQLVVAGHTWWKLHEAARLAARARYVAVQRGDSSAGERRGREILAALAKGSSAGSRQTRILRDGSVSVSAELPLVGPFQLAANVLHAPRMSATSRFAP